MGIDRRQFLKFLAFIPFVASRINFKPKPGWRPGDMEILLSKIVTPTVKAKAVMDDLGINVQWSQDGITWYDVLDPPFHTPCLCKIDGGFKLSNGGRVGGIIIDKDLNSN